MKLSPAQLRALRNLDVASDTHGNAMFHETEYPTGWFIRKRRGGCKVNTMNSLRVHGLVECNPFTERIFRLSERGADELRQRGITVYTHSAARPSDAGEEGGAAE